LNDSAWINDQQNANVQHFHCSAQHTNNNIHEHTFTQDISHNELVLQPSFQGSMETGIGQQTVITAKHKILECGPMPNLMVALPNIGGALCSTPQRLADAHY